jgi:predicted AAA+ superfamily ATPase
MLFSRTLAPELQKAAGPFPVLFLTGPRQSGKTTLARMAFPDYQYVSLEDPQLRAEALEDPRGLLRRIAGAPGVIFDEAQRAPDLFSYLQGVVDERRGGPFVLTGSQNFLLSERITQTLAGRTAVFELLPFSVAELARRQALTPVGFSRARDAAGDVAAGLRPALSLDDLLFTGAYPAIHDRGADPGRWLRSYISTYVERDARAVGAIGDLDTFLRFLGLCAGRSGQLLNLAALGAEAGVSHSTARRWLSILRASYIVEVLAPHHENFGKRIVKTPKLYFLDTGLLCALLGLRGAEDLRTHPLRGAIFETFVVSELTKLFVHYGERARLFFWRDSHGTEVDALVDLGRERVAVEAKAGMTVAGDAFRGLEAYERLRRASGGEGTGGVLVYGGDEWYERRGSDVRPWWACT